MLAKKYRHFVVVCLLAALAGCSGDAAEDRIAQFEAGLHAQADLDVKSLFNYDPVMLNLADRMSHYKIPGLSIAVISDYQIDWYKHWGLRDAGTGSPVLEDTIFEAGSASKLVTAVMAMMLVERGVLALDTPVNDNLQSWQIPENEFTAGHPVTLRHLLSHTSGINRPDSMFFFEENTLPTLHDVLNGALPAINDPVTVDFVPGQQHRYSNLAYNVIQLLIEESTGQAFAVAVRENILEPLGMHSCTYTFPFPDEIADRVAAPHDDALKAWPNDLNPAALAHGGLLCTSEDLAKLAVELMNAWRGQSNRILSAETVGEMFSGQHPVEDEVGGFNGQGLGVFLLGDAEVFYFAHQGYNTPGTCALVIGTPSSGQGAVIMANGAQGFQLIFEILGGLADEYEWPPVQVVE